MRDTHEKMPEILSAYERGGKYFGVVRKTIGSESRALEFGVPVDEYKALRRILQTRPFDQMPGLQYRYFIAGSIGPSGEHRATVDIRIEQGRNGRQVSSEIPISLAKNLYWFFQLKDLKDATHLHTVDQSTPEI